MIGGLGAIFIFTAWALRIGCACMAVRGIFRIVRFVSGIVRHECMMRPHSRYYVS